MNLIKEKILVVDDSKLSRMLLSSIISSAYPDCSILAAGSADEVLGNPEMVGAGCMIIDMNMPGMDGITLAARLKERNSSVVIALCTANVQESVKSRAEAQGLIFIAKPITEDKILGFLSKAGGSHVQSR